MSEVSSWSNTDAGNNLTPPDGWPEGMQPSGVNDVGRMMMGAIKRWYDTVTAGIANALPLSGGTLTGPLTAPGIHSTANINADGDIGGRNIYATANIQTTGDLYGRNIYGTANIQTTGDVLGRDFHASRDLTVGGNETVTGTLSVGGNETVTGTLSVGAALTAGSLSSNSTITANSSISADSASITNSATIGNALTVNAVVDTTHYNINGWLFAYRTVDGVGTGHAICNAASSPSIILYGSNGSYYRCDNAHFFTNQAATLNICRFQATDGNCINASGLWNSVSDVSTKEADSIEPYRAGLAAALKLNTVSFRYAPGANPFAIDGQTYYGLVAQDVERVVPEMVGRTDDGLATVASGHLVFVLLNAVKELEARLAQVENRGG